MRRLMLLIAVGGLWLFLAALPVFADGGPHVQATNSGASTLTADSCAGCHRAHTASGEYLINQASEVDLCLGCHGSATAGATVDVMTGAQYRFAPDGTRDPANTLLGATRAGGFDQARIGGVARIDTGTSFRTKVVVDTTLDADNDVTSAHIVMPAAAGLDNQGIAWGSGTTGLGEASVSLHCSNCHNPHGNNQYRILNQTPNAGSIALQAYDIADIDPDLDLITTKTGNEFMAGDVVAFQNVTDMTATSYTVVWSSGTSFQVGTFAAAGTFTVAPIGGADDVGTVTRYQAVVTDSPLKNYDYADGSSDTKNYTVIQKQGTQGTDSSYYLYAQDVITAGVTAEKGDYWHRQVPWNAGGASDDGPNGQPATNPSAAVGDVAFNVQINAWCTSCHTRYFANTNQPSGTFTDAVVEPAYGLNISAANATTNVLTTGSYSNAPAGTTYRGHGLLVDDVVTVSGLDGVGVTNGDYRVTSVLGSHTFTLGAEAAPHAAVDIAAGTLGSPTVVRKSAVQNAQTWWFPRADAAGVEDDTYKFQHRTISNRVCTTCHVSHGSNRDMTGTYSSTYERPDQLGTLAGSDSSRLLKIDNRGTCQGCHDPTGPNFSGTWAANIPNGTAPNDFNFQGDPAAWTGGTSNGATPPVYIGGTAVTP